MLIGRLVWVGLWKMDPWQCLSCGFFLLLVHNVLSLYSSCDLFVKMIPCTYFKLTTDDYSDILNVYFPMEAGCDLISVFSVCLSVCLSDSRNYWSDFHENRQERTDYILYMYMLRTFYPMFHCICMYVMSGLRLSNLNKETTYLLTYLLILEVTRIRTPDIRTPDLDWICLGAVRVLSFSITCRLSCGWQRLNTFEFLVKYPAFIMMADFVDRLPTTAEDILVQTELHLLDYRADLWIVILMSM